MRFIEKSLRSLLKAAERAASAERIAVERGFLQALDPRIKIASLFILLIVVAASRELSVIAAIFAFAWLLAGLSHVPLRSFTPSLFFTGLIALPAVFISPRSAAFLITRAETAATLSTLLVLTTAWPRILATLRWFRLPAVIVMILGMTARYIFVILQTALEMLESRKSRTVGVMPPADRRRLATASAGMLLSKSVALSNEVHAAMLSRGFRGEIRLLEDAK